MASTDQTPAAEEAAAVRAALERAERNRRHWRWRAVKDRVAHLGMAVGGLGVIIAILLIFVYLLWVTLPLFRPARLDAPVTYALPGAGRTAYLAMEEQAEVGARFGTDGRLVFFSTRDGRPIGTPRRLVPAGVTVTSFAAGDPATGIFAYGLADGRAVVVRHSYAVTYPKDRRLITPKVEFPLGETPVQVDPRGRPLVQISAQVVSEAGTVAALTDDGRLVLVSLAQEASLLGEGDWKSSTAVIPGPGGEIRHLILDPDQRRLYLADEQGRIHYYDVSDKSAPRRVQTRQATAARGETLTALEFLSGGISLIVGSSTGRLAQWFPVRGADNTYTLEHVRDFPPMDGTVRAIAPEYRRKGFLVADDRGGLGIYHATAHRRVLATTLADGPVDALAVAPRANALLAEQGGRLRYQGVHNEYPEVSWSSLWGKVWYEGYDKPAYVWQSSSASNDFEPKFSLTPLALGTLKAAFYAMIFAIPLALLGAIYTAHFMAPAMRRWVKPVIEIMEALPTVILGFLAGLWLAPYMEQHLPGIFALLLLMPPAVVAFAYLWHHLPRRWRRWVPEGWEALVTLPVLVLVAWLALAASQPLELWWFGGDIRLWLSHEMGIPFDQRNALVVGFAMGFAVIPTIFSIAEDAIFGVPRHLTYGSLALGATPWQTLTRVVILTASPGIFSAVMIGLGRAVGETMIVLMATGNTPVMDFSIFQGMRTLSANIAVEMPEAEVASTHYRILFLAALVLFLATFAFNTAAEIVRQRLRRKYSSI